jgi:hypothetical protein
MNEENLRKWEAPEVQNVLRLFSPIFVLDEEEEYFPEDPLDFLRASRFRHHRSGRSDQGWSKISNSWVTGDSHSPEFYDIPVAKINSFKAWEDGRNRRPRDSKCGESENVFLQPPGRRTGVRSPNGRVPCFYHVIQPMPGQDLFLVVKYWIFHGYSDGLANFNHQGDWESIAVGINANLEPDFVSFAAHGNYTPIPWNRVLKEEGRPLSFIERGTHANFYNGRRGHANGYRWDVSYTLESLEHQPWRDFAGAWGEVGDPGTDLTTGPLGPLYKTNY